MNSVCIGVFYRRRSVNIFRNRISTLKYGRSFNEALTVVEKMVVRLMFSWLWNNECVLFISISTFYLLDNHNAYAAKSKTSITMNGYNHTWMRTLSLVEKFWTRLLLLDTYIIPKVCDCMYRWCGASQNSIRGYTKCIWTTTGMLYRELIILWVDFGQIW